MLVFLSWLSAPSVLHADTEGAYLRSYEWLCDSSDLIVLVDSDSQEITVREQLKGSASASHPFTAGRTIAEDSIKPATTPSLRLFSIRVRDRGTEPEPEILFFRIATDRRVYLAERLSLARPFLVRGNDREEIRFFSVDRFGHPVKKSDVLLNSVRRRIARGSVIPMTADRELAENASRLRPLNNQPFGARWIDSMDLSIGDYAFSICIPDPSDWRPRRHGQSSGAIRGP